MFIPTNVDLCSIDFITVTSHERHCLSDHRYLYCLFNISFRLTTMKTQGHQYRTTFHAIMSSYFAVENYFKQNSYWETMDTFSAFNHMEIANNITFSIARVVNFTVIGGTEVVVMTNQNSIYDYKVSTMPLYKVSTMPFYILVLNIQVHDDEVAWVVFL